MSAMNQATKTRKARDPSSNGRHMSPEQRAHLINFMESHPTFARSNMCPGPMGKFQGDVMWTSLAEQLNQMGPAVRPVKKWRQAWADMKYDLKGKIATKKNLPTGNIASGGRRVNQSEDNMECEEDADAPVSPPGTSPEELAQDPTLLTDQERVVFELFGEESWIGEAKEEELGLSVNAAKVDDDEVIYVAEHKMEDDPSYIEGCSQHFSVPACSQSFVAPATLSTSSTSKSSSAPAKKRHSQHLSVPACSQRFVAPATLSTSSTSKSSSAPQRFVAPATLSTSSTSKSSSAPPKKRPILSLLGGLKSKSLQKESEEEIVPPFQAVRNTRAMEEAQQVLRENTNALNRNTRAIENFTTQMKLLTESIGYLNAYIMSEREGD